jgi:hypothetical protein
MGGGGSGFVDIVIQWMPAILLAGVYIFFVSYRGGFRKYQVDCLEEQRRQNRLLERIADALERKP